MTTPVTVRPAAGHDVPALARVAEATFALACPPSMTPERIERFVSEVLSPERFHAYLADPARAVLLAEGDEPLGYAMLVHGEPTDEDVRAAVTARPTVELSKIYVLPAAHGTGAAGALMAAGLAWAAGRGAAGVWLGVNQQNARAQRFYAKSGFAVVGTKQFDVGGRLEDDFVMEQRLERRPEGATTD